MTYEEQLQTTEWKQKRESIKKRDGHKCFICGKKENLEVHHIFYFDDLMAWEYDDYMLLTLCEICHELEHKMGRVSQELIRFARKVLNRKQSIYEYERELELKKRIEDSND